MDRIRQEPAGLVVRGARRCGGEAGGGGSRGLHRSDAGGTVAIAIVQEPGGYEFDSGRLAQNIMLAADAVGVASCPVRCTATVRRPPPSDCRRTVVAGMRSPSDTRATGPRFARRRPQTAVRAGS